MLESQTSVPPRTIMSSGPLNSYSLAILSVTTPTTLDVWKGPPKFQGIQAFPKQIEGKKWSVTFYTKFPIVLNLPGSAETLNLRRKCRKLLVSVPGKSVSKSSIPNQPASTSRRRDHEAEYCIIVSLIRCVVLSKRPLR